MNILRVLLENPVSDWLKNNAFYLAISFAAILLIIVLVIFILSKKKEH